MNEPSAEAASNTGGRTRHIQVAERWLAAIVESSDDAIVGETLAGIITSWNAGATRVFGYEADEAIGKPITFLAWPGAEEQVKSLLEKLRHGERVDHFE